jgi:hypothetical protein
MTITVTLAILVPHVPENERASVIAVRLAEMGGRLTGWRPETDGAPARAYFIFKSEQERERFVTGALGIPGVSLEMPQP